MKIERLNGVLLLGFLFFLFTPFIPISGGTSTDWVTVSYSPDILNYAVAVTGAGGNVYILNSSTSPPPYCKFWRYKPADNSWETLAVPELYPGYTIWAKNGTSMTWDSGNYIYALLGGSYNDKGDKARHYFYRYSISGNTWGQLKNTPDSGGQGAGDAITWVPGSVLGTETHWIYTIVGSKEGKHGTSFWRYNINNNSWQELPYNPSWSGEGSDDGSSLVWAGGDYLYALQGEWHESDASKDRAFARFDLTDNSWDDLPDIPEEGGVCDGGSLVWVGGSHSDNIYALGGGGAYWPGHPGTEPPGENFYCYSISDNSWAKLSDLPYGITDQNGPRLGYANENIYCWRGWKKEGDYPDYEGPEDVLWAYAVPEAEPERGVSVSISPSWRGGVPGTALEFTVIVKNTGNAVDSYDLTVEDDAGWGPTLADNLLKNVAPDEEKTAILTVAIPDNENLIGVKDNITVTATSQENVEVSDNASCIAYAGEENTFYLNLAKGWNIVSFPVTSGDTTLENLFAGVGYTMKYYVAPYGPFKFAPPDKPVELGLGYLLKLDNNKTITVTGVPPENYTMDLVAGWQIVGFPLTSENTTPDNLFAGGGYTIKYYVAPYGPFKEAPPDKPVELGLGYLLKLDNDKTVTIPL